MGAGALPRRPRARPGRTRARTRGRLVSPSVHTRHRMPGSGLPRRAEACGALGRRAGTRSTRSAAGAEGPTPEARVGPASFIPLGEGAARVSFPSLSVMMDDGVLEGCGSRGMDGNAPELGSTPSSAGGS